MKINVSVDLSEFYSEEGNASFSEQIKDSIVYSVKQQVLKDWNAKITSDFTNQIRSAIQDEKTSHLAKCISDTINAVKLNSGNGEQFSIGEYVDSEFKRIYSIDTQIKMKLDSAVETQAKSAAVELKNRYDLMFASSLVSKMNELGMLKPDVAALILGTGEQK